MNGINQLFKGVIIGIVLLLAVIGLLNISGKNNEIAPDQTEITAPTISVNTPDSSIQTDSISDQTISNDPNNIPALSTPDSNDQLNKDSNKEDATVENVKDTYKPEIIEEPIIYGTLNISAIQSKNGTSQKVDFLIYDSNNKQVATSKDKATASFHLPTGRYIAITLLGDQRKTQTILVQKDKTSTTTVKVQAPINTGILQVSAVLNKTNKPQKTSFTIQDQNGNTVGQRQQVSSTLFKLKAGTYRVLANNDNLSEERTVVIEAGSSSKEIFRLKKQPSSLGKVVVKALEEDTNNTIRADFVIATQNGKLIQQFNSVPNAELALSAGRYQIRATGPSGQSSRNITIIAGQRTSEVFRFRHPVTEPPASSPQTSQPQAEIVDIKNQPNTEAPVVASTPPEIVTQDSPAVLSKGLLKLSAVSASNKKPVKSNFYIQTPNGKHIAREIYKNSASFNLEKGIYKITIKSKNMKTITKTMTVNPDSKLNQIFAMHNLAENTPPEPIVSNAPIIKNSPNTPRQGVPPTRNAPIYTNSIPVKAPVGVGSLVLNMQPARNLKTSRNALLSNFEIKTKSGKNIAQINKVQHATVKLDEGEYTVTAKLRGRKKSKSFRIQNSQATRVSFKSSDFSSINNQPNRATRLGLLVSKVIDNNGRPLKGNLTVTNLKGKVVYRANNVSIAKFELPAQPHTVNIKHDGLSGSERVNIIAGETTVQTFTIASNPAQQTNHSRNNQRKTPSGRELRDALKDKLEEELKRIVR